MTSRSETNHKIKNFLNYCYYHYLLLYLLSFHNRITELLLQLLYIRSSDVNWVLEKNNQN